MNYMLIEKASISNGPGFRVVLWVSGCSIKCAGCHNPETWDFNAGHEFDADAKRTLLNLSSLDWVKGLTISGGHPLEACNEACVFDVIYAFKRYNPDKDVWLYTGIELDISNFYEKSERGDLLRQCDVVVDGPYIECERDITLPFRGSSNQRLIDVQKSLSEGTIVLYEPN